MNLAIKNIETALDVIENIDLVEGEMLKMPQVPCPVRHHFGPGVCIREVFMPAGTFAVGHYQKKPHMNIFLKGKVHMLKDDGTTEIIEAPMIFTGQPGRKIGMILEDMVWLNVYPTDKKDVEEIEEEFIDKSETFRNFKDEIKLLDHNADRDDYLLALKDTGLTEEQVRSMSENEDDLIPFPDIPVSVKISRSNIDGKGVFATADFCTGEVIAPARMGANRTPAGRYINHSLHPNAMIKVSGQVIYLEAIKPIKGCLGGQDGEEITIDYRQSAETIRSLSCQS